MTSPLSEAALNLAASNVGKHEEPLGSNWGPFVQSCLFSVGIKFPAAWCMAFVYKMFNDAAIATGVHNPLPRTAGVLAMWNFCPAVRVTSPQIGDVMIMDFGNGAGHTGIIESTDTTYLYTIEGNSNDNGSREGTAVVRRRRLRSDARIKGFLRF